MPATPEVSALPPPLHLIAARGADFVLGITWKQGSPPSVVDTTGFTGQFVVNLPSSAGGPLGFAAAVGDAGTLVLHLTNTQVGTVSVGDHPYRLYMTAPGGQVSVLLQGTFTVR